MIITRGSDQTITAWLTGCHTSYLLIHKVITVNALFNLIFFFFFAAAQEPGWVTVTLKSQYDILLGETKIQYVDEEDEFLQRIVNEPNLQCKLFKKLQVNAETTGGNETQNSGNTGKTVLCSLTVVVYSKCYPNTKTLLVEWVWTASWKKICGVELQILSLFLPTFHQIPLSKLYNFASAFFSSLNLFAQHTHLGKKLMKMVCLHWVMFTLHVLTEHTSVQ